MDLEGSKLRCPLGMIMVLDPVEVFGYTPGSADKVKVELDNGTDLGSLSRSLEGSHDGIHYGSFLGYSQEVQKISM